MYIPQLLPTAQNLEQLNESLKKSCEAREKHTVQMLTNVVSNTISTKVESAVKQELRPLVVSTLEKVTQKHMEKINMQVTQVM